MKQQWSAKKVLFFWLAFVAVLVIIFVFVTPDDIRDNLYVNIVLYVIVGLAILATIWMFVWLAIMIPYAIIKDRKEKRRVRNAKWDAYYILDLFETARLERSFGQYKHYQLARLKGIEKIRGILLEKQEDREARHLVNDLYELEHKLEQIPDKKEEEETDEDSLLKAMSTGDLEVLKAKHKKNPSVTKLVDGILEARGKATKEF